MATIEIKGINDLNKVFRELGKGKGLAAIRKGILITGQEILTESQRNLTQNGQRVTNALFRSGKVSKTQSELAYEISYDANYAYYVEFGRKPGKGLNEEGIEQVAQWAIKKGLASRYSIKTRKRVSENRDTVHERARQIAFFISGRYKRRGRKGKPFLYPAFEAKKGNLFNNISKSFNEFVERIKVK